MVYCTGVKGSQGTTDSYSCNMESSQSKRSASFSEQTSHPLSEKDLEELQSTLPPDKKLKAGREYIWNRKSKRKAEYWKYYLEYVENGKLRAECKFCPKTFAADGEAIGKAVEACLEYWGIDDKIFTVTVDNASSNDVACAHLSRMNMVCALIELENAVKYVKDSPARILRFKDLVQKANIDSKSSLSFDVPTRWNSTYIMLETALKFRRVFSGLSLPDGEDFE
uniref:Uncharacterized protein n=1 Tax=Chenopodium quinoa TaxID=63459 RepID=A0A803M8M8_CHEQI